MTERRLNQSMMRQSNEKYVLMTLVASRSASRPYLAEMTGISLMSVGRICDKLIDLGIIRETDDTFVNSKSGGRPAKGLSLNDQSLLCCGIYLGKNSLQMGVVSPYGNVLEKRQYTTSALTDTSPDSVLHWAASRVKEFLAPWHGKGLVQDIGIATSGIVDRLGGELAFSANLKWENVPVAAIMSEALPEYNFLLENDTKALAMAEYQCGAFAGEPNMVILALDDGIGSAALLDGKLYRAKNNMAGEIGHIVLNPAGKVCECGQVGCLQTQLAKNVLLNEARTVYPGISLSDLVRKSQQGEPFAVGLINQFLSASSIAINLLANMYSPEVILISGSTIWESPVLRDMIEKNYKKKLNKYICDEFQLKFDSFGPNSYLVGAAAVAFSQVMDTLVVKHI